MSAMDNINSGNEGAALQAVSCGHHTHSPLGGRHEERNGRNDAGTRGRLGQWRLDATRNWVLHVEVPRESDGESCASSLQSQVRVDSNSTSRLGTENADAGRAPGEQSSDQRRLSTALKQEHREDGGWRHQSAASHLRSTGHLGFFACGFNTRRGIARRKHFGSQQLKELATRRRDTRGSPLTD